MSGLTCARCAVFIVGLAAHPVLAAAAASPPIGRPWTPQTSIEARYFALDFAEPQNWPSPRRGQDGILHSPDRRYFVYLDYRGEVASDAAVARVSLYSRDTVRRALRARAARVAPLRRFELRSTSSSLPAIAALRWDEDSRGLLFRTVDPDGIPYVYHFDIASGNVRSVARASRARPDDLGPVFGYRNGTSLLVAVSREARPAPAYPAQWLDRQSDGMPLFNDLLWMIRGAQVRTSFRWEARCDGRPAPSPDIILDVTEISVAPRGCRAILLIRRAAGGFDYRLLNVSTGLSRAVAGARNGRPSISWSPDGQWALLQNLAGAGSDATPVAMLSVESGELQLVTGAVRGTNNDRVRPRWLSASRAIIADPASPTGASWLEWNAGRWMRRPGADLRAFETPDDGVEVAVRQGLNDPARVVARLGPAEILLSDPDPALAGVARRDWREFSWTMADGRTAHAALMLPTRRPGQSRPPPLVVNPYHYENYGQFNRLFLPDGLHGGAESAAQALAARGFAVLWMDGWDDMSVAATPREGPAFVARLDAALTELVRQGLVDSQRIGMAGFSRGGFLTIYSATHPGRVPIATHVAIDNFMGASAAAFFDRTNGVPEESTPNIFTDRAGVMARDTLLNVDKVRGPVLFTRNLRGRGGEPEWIRQTAVNLQIMSGAFMAARRPFDQLIFPEGVHLLQRPSERLALMHAIVDWMAFWLMDEMPADPGRARIWTQMRAQWRRQQAWEAAGNPVASTPPADFQPATAPAPAASGS